MKRSFQEEACGFFIKYSSLSAEEREDGFNDLASLFISRLGDRTRRTGLAYEGAKGDLMVLMALSVAVVCFDTPIVGEGARAFISWCMEGACGKKFTELYTEPDIFSLNGEVLIPAQIQEEVSPLPNADNLPRGRYFLRWFPFPHILCVPIASAAGADFVSMRKGLELFGEARLVRSLSGPLHLFFACGFLPWADRGGISVLSFRKRPSEKLCRAFFGRKFKGSEVFLASDAGRYEPDVDEVVKLLKKGEEVLFKWESLGIIPGKNVFLRPGFVLGFLGVDPSLQKMLDEDLLVWHDVLVCILAKRFCPSAPTKKDSDVFISKRKESCPTENPR